MTLKKVRVAILCSFNLDLIENELVRQAKSVGIQADIYLSGYGQWESDAINPQSRLHKFQPEVVFLFLETADLLPALTPGNMIWELKKAEAAGRAVWERAWRVIQELYSRLPRSAIIIVHSLVSTPFNPLGLLESNSGFSYRVAANIFNDNLRTAARKQRRLIVLDYERVVSLQGWDKLYDSRLWYVGRMRLGQSGVVAVAHEYIRYLAAIYTPRRKCLVVDLDNTLWGGVIGEDGISGIEIGHQGIGLAYREFQMAILALSQRGIILAAASKNNPGDVTEVFARHPDMVLRQDSFACMEINWGQKTEALKRIAKRLNIGLDSLVFWDDNPLERNLVRTQLPQVLVPDVPQDVSLWPRFLLGLECFDELSLTDEDRRRGEMYRQQIERENYLVKVAEAGSDSSKLEDYLHSLEIVAVIRPADELSIPRIAQLTQRTNQFNLTTRRYSEGDIRNMVQDPAFKVFSLAVRDRFGNLGIVGAAIVKTMTDVWTINTFLMSCRALGRRVEDALLFYLVSEAGSAKAKLVGEFIPTAKNQPAREFLERIGVNLTAADDGTFRFNVKPKIVKLPQWISLIYER